MKNAKNANFWQIDNKLKKISKLNGIVILPSFEAWEKFIWTRKFLKKKPKEGYFIWIKNQINFPLTTCINVVSPKISQNLNNLLVVEKNIKAKMNAVCSAAKNNLCAKHRAKGKLLLKQGASLEYEHFHKWGQNDFVNLEYEFTLEKNSRLAYSYKNLFPPKRLEASTIIRSMQGSSSNLEISINALNSEIKIKDTTFLQGKKSQGLVKLRLVGGKKSQISALSRMIAKAPAKGHLDCQGLLIDNSSKISLIPELICQNKEAQITHEASIGKISEEQLNYLKMRGLTEKEAIELIIGGFLKI